MPQVPQLTSPTESPSDPIDIRGHATGEAFGTQVGAAEQGLGRSVEGFGDMLAKHALQMQERANQARGKDLFLASTVEAGNVTAEYDSLEGVNKVNAYPKYQQKLEDIRQKYRGQAGNEEVAHSFDNDFARRMGFMIVDGAKQAATANRKYNQDTNLAAEKNAVDFAAQNAQDDVRFKDALKTVHETVDARAADAGWPPDRKEQEMRTSVSGAWETRLRSLSEKNPLQAKQLFKDNLNDIGGEARLRIEHSINQNLITKGAPVAADMIVKANTSQMIDQLTNKGDKLRAAFDFYISKGYTKAQAAGWVANLMSESASFNPDEVHDGGIGRGIAGWNGVRLQNLLKFGKDNDMNPRLFSTQLEFSHWEANNTEKAAGDRLRAAQTPEEAGNAVLSYERPKDWDKGAHPERAARARQVFNMLSGEESGPVTGTSGEGRVARAYRAAEDFAARQFPDDPALQQQFGDTIKSRINTQYSLLQKSVKDNERALKNTVNTELNDQEKKPTSIEQLSPEAQEAYKNSNEDMKKAYRTQMERNAKADVPLTPARRDRFTELRGLSLTNPEKFADINPADEDLTNVQRNDITKLQQNQKALVQKGAKMRDALGTPGVRALLNDSHIFESKTDNAANKRFIQFSGEYESVLNNLEQEKKRVLTDKEKTEAAAGLLRQVVTSPGMFRDSKSSVYEARTAKTPAYVSIEEARALPSGTRFIINGEKDIRVRK